MFRSIRQGLTKAQFLSKPLSRKLSYQVYSLNKIKPVMEGEAWIAPTAAVIGDVTLKNNSSVWFGAVIRGDNEPIVVGEDSNVQDNAVLHTDPGMPLTIGKGVTIGHSANLHGCTIGDNSLIGIGATVLNGVSIGQNCLIAANSIVTGGEVPDNSLVVGSPARVKRELSQEEIEGLTKNAQVYVEKTALFKDGLSSRNIS